MDFAAGAVDYQRDGPFKRDTRNADVHGTAQLAGKARFIEEDNPPAVGQAHKIGGAVTQAHVHAGGSHAHHLGSALGGHLLKGKIP